ncbi:hypothetical protein [Nocardia sp. IFM 10818]
MDKFAADSPSNAALTAAVLATLFRRTENPSDDLRRAAADLRMLEPTEQLDMLKGHGEVFVPLLTAAVDAVSLADLTETIFPAATAEQDSPRARAARRRYLDYLFAALSHLRAEIGRSALNVDVHLWIRELSRIDRAVSNATSYHWADDGAAEDPSIMYLPALFCRHCGRSGWGARLAPTGNSLDVSDESIRAHHASGGARFRALISAPWRLNSASRSRAALATHRRSRNQ